jgi:hypothetical protein
MPGEASSLMNIACFESLLLDTMLDDAPGLPNLGNSFVAL